MKMSEFESMVRSGLRQVPARFRAVMRKEGVKVLPRARRPAALRGERHWTLGIFIGPAYTERSHFESRAEPVRIELYKDSFEKCFGRGKEMEKQIALTVIHEAGHYFGFSERDLQRYMGR